MGPADSRFRQDLAVAALVALGAFLVAWLVAELWIRRPIQAHREPGRPPGRRRALGTESPEPMPHGELGQLMSTMNATAAALEQQRADIDELDERLRRSQRLESIGQLTGGIAHDFNNLLTVVVGNADLLASDEHATEDQRDAGPRPSRNAAQRGAALTKRLLAFARRQALTPTSRRYRSRSWPTSDLLLRRTARRAHRDPSSSAQPTSGPALVDEGQMEDALLNLCVNARDAMPGGGRLTLETANVELEADYAARQVDVQPGAYVSVAVSDTGVGHGGRAAVAGVRAVLHDQGQSKGTGLGLAMVYGFVKQSAGHITIYSEVGLGTTVTLYLPRAAAADGIATSRRHAPLEDVVGGTETILMVEDDPSVRAFGSGRLRDLGYRVLEAADGPAALAVIEQDDRIDLLFTDVVMPGGMDGRALSASARARRPGLRVLYTSGYSEHAILHHGRLDPDSRLLPKPYGRDALARAIRAALDEEQPAPVS